MIFHNTIINCNYVSPNPCSSRASAGAEWFGVGDVFEGEAPWFFPEVSRSANSTTVSAQAGWAVGF